VDSGTLDRDFAAVLDGSTGEFHDMYTRSSGQLRQLLLDNKATGKGTVLDAAVKSATETKVEVLLFIDQTVTNTASADPRVDRSRVLMTMELVDGRWLASRVYLP
jgi:Mce-associated membrane protein